MIVAIIEPDLYNWTTELQERLRDVLCNLVVRQGAFIFLFANVGDFEDYCYEIVTKLKKRFPYVERHYYHGGCDYDKGYVDYMADLYDNLHFPPMGAQLSQHMRTCTMIDICDILVTCGAVWAEEYALKKKKRIINIFQQ